MGYRGLANTITEAHDRKHIIKQEVPPGRPSEVSKTVADNVPILLHGDKYGKLRKEGLGVDHNERKEKKLEA
jgi:hypothetical protein